MNTESERQRLKVFLTALGIAALAINLISLSSCSARVAPTAIAPQYAVPAPTIAVPNQQADIEKQQEEAAARKAAEEHAQFLARYVDPAFTKSSGLQTVALAVSAGNGKTDRAVANALYHRFETGTVQILPSFFKPAFITDGFFDSALNGSDDVSSKLELAKSLDELLLARESVEYSTNSELQNSISADVHLEVSTVPLSALSTGQTWSFTASGVGFTQAAAFAMAQERLVKQIAEDKKMSL